MAETNDEFGQLGAEGGEDVPMEDGEIAKPDGVVGVNGTGDLGGWKRIHFGLVGHSGNCEICAAMREHISQAMGSGIASDIVSAVQEMIADSHARLQFPVMSIDDWADSLAPVINCPSGTLPVTPMSWLTYLANTLTVEIASAEVVWRQRNRPPGVRKEDVDYEERQRHSRLRLLRDVLDVTAKLQTMTVSDLFTPVSDVTPLSVTNELPRRMRGVGDSRYPRRPVFPEFRVIKTYLGDIVCAVPSRPLSPFELIEGDHSLILPRGAGGHTHIPGSLWNFVPRVACSEEDLRKCTWPMIYESATDLLRLFIEALVIPWFARSLMQRSWVYWFLHTIINDHGEEAAAAICDAVHIVDLDEQTEYWARTTSEVPLFVNRTVVGNTWHWDEVGLTVWQLVARVFPHGPSQAMTALRYPRDRDASVPRPPFIPIELRVAPTLSVYSYNQVHEHLINVCGVEIGDLKHFFDLARGWDNIDREARNMQENSKWNDLENSGNTSTVGVPAIVFEHDDPPISSISAVQLLASFDRRRDPLRRAPAAAPTQPRNSAGQASGSGHSSSASSSSHAGGNPSVTIPPASATLPPPKFGTPFKKRRLA